MDRGSVSDSERDGSAVYIREDTGKGNGMLFYIERDMEGDCMWCIKMRGEGWDIVMDQGIRDRDVAEDMVRKWNRNACAWIGRVVREDEAESIEAVKRVRVRDRGCVL